MSSQCTNDGTYTLTVTFKHGIDLNMAQVLVQNRVTLAAAASCPTSSSRPASPSRKKSPDILLIVNLILARRHATTSST